MAHRKLHDKFALSGGIPNVLLSYGKPDEVRAFCRRVIDEVARDGGYIMDAGAIMQDDTSIENLRVMTQTAREYGVYAAGAYKPPAATPPSQLPASVADRQNLPGLSARPHLARTQQIERNQRPDNKTVTYCCCGPAELCA